MGAAQDCKRFGRSLVSLMPGARIKFKGLALALPDDRSAPHRQEPGVLLQGLAWLEARWPQHGHRRPMFGIAYRLIANCVDGRLARHASEALRRPIIVGMRPLRAAALERGFRQIDQA